MPLQSAKQRGVAYARFGRPIFGAHSATVDREVIGDGRVSLLDIFRGPSAIIFRVSEFCFDAINRVKRAGLWTHISQKLLESVFSKPLWAHGYAKRAIVFVGGVGWRIAAAFHGFPCCLFRGWLPTVNMFSARQSHGSCIVNAKAATRFGVSSAQRFSGCLGFFAAFANAFPPSARALLSSLKNGKPSEFLSSEIKYFWHLININRYTA